MEYVYIFRILLASLCGGVIGIERQFRTKSAGTRTHIMIAIASCLLMLISKYGFNDVLGTGVNWDVSRVAAGIVTSIGILGGGLFFTGRQGYVSGITTAAGLLVTLGVGMAIGTGMYKIAIFTTGFVAVLQLLFHKNLWIVQQSNRVTVVFKTNDSKKEFVEIEQRLTELGISLIQLRYEKRDDSEYLTCQVVIPGKYSKKDIVNMLSTFEELISFEIS